jgi:hypothetical protein
MHKKILLLCMDVDTAIYAQKMILDNHMKDVIVIRNVEQIQMNIDSRQSVDIVAMKGENAIPLMNRVLQRSLKSVSEPFIGTNFNPFPSPHRSSRKAHYRGNHRY